MHITNALIIKESPPILAGRVVIDGSSLTESPIIRAMAHMHIVYATTKIAPMA